MPERRGIDRLVKAEDFFDTAITVGGDHQVLPRKARPCVSDTDNDVVVKLALLVVDEQIVRTPVLADAVEDRTKHPFAR